MRNIGAPERNDIMRVPAPVYFPAMSSLVLPGMKTAGSMRAAVVIMTVIRPHPTIEVVEKERLPLSKTISASIKVTTVPMAAKRKEYPQLNGRGTPKRF